MSSPSAAKTGEQDYSAGNKSQKGSKSDSDQSRGEDHAGFNAARRLDGEFLADEKISAQSQSQILPGAWQAFIDENGNTYYFNTETKESSWEFPGAQSSKPSSTTGDAIGGLNAPNLTAEGINNAPASSSRGAEAGDARDAVAALKREHDEASKRLQEMLAAEKARKLQLLEDRLMRRQQLRAKGGGDLDGTTDVELEQEIYEQGQKMDQLTKNILSGFKKRCYYEMKVMKEAGGRNLSEEEVLTSYLSICFILLFFKSHLSIPNSWTMPPGMPPKT